MLDKKYVPQEFEKDIYEFWMQNNLFKADAKSEKPAYCIVLPPPNITDKLHVGHAYNAAIQDTLIRYKKLKGFETLFQPGTDHAAIATEAKIVGALKSKGINKFDLTREQFLSHAQEWYDKYNKIIIEQYKSLGVACDWSRLAFTMDEHCSKAVTHVFCNLFDEGLIYKGDRMTNYCPNCMTALSDIEIKYEDANSHLWYINYPFADEKGGLTVATTRPETLLGDTALAVNPSDERYKHLVGKFVCLPLLHKKIPIIADYYVEKEFGTGVVKITPSHDANDYEVGNRHNLEQVSVIDKNGIMSSSAGIYAGLNRFEAREKIVNDLKAEGNLIKIENYKNKISKCDRCGEIVEPTLSKQWFVKMDSLKQPAIDAVKNGEIVFIPSKYKKIYMHWMENLHDWCISRQLYSGHQIPVYTCSKGHVFCSETKPEKCKICADSHLTQETDVLDTWFSSALWPFSTLGFPDNDEFLNKFYPTDVLCTAYEILFLWVSRMIFSGLKHIGKIPFKKALIHGMVRDEHGLKMSKNFGNGINPTDVINEYGSDALRMSIVSNVTMGQDCRYSMKKAQNYAFFINKLYNASKFVLLYLPDEVKQINQLNLTMSDKWILKELNDAITFIDKKFEKPEISACCNKMYEFVWNKFCDNYIEMAKIEIQSGNADSKNVLLYVLKSILIMLHPIIPFVTEKIYQQLPDKKISIMQETFPKIVSIKKLNADHLNVNEIIETIKIIRNIRAENKISEKQKIRICLRNYADFYIAGKEIISKLCNASTVEFDISQDALNDYIFYQTPTVQIYIKSDEEISADEQLKKLNEQFIKNEQEINRSQTLLSNPNFLEKAPSGLVEKEKEKLNKFIELKNNLQNSINALKK